ncbi:MAG: TRAP transporter small permease subunit [Hyphomicrobiaceae bacterium]|nr:TRAP transporter small permease subunit [Hyphomicrobiaceae bacterium]
MWNKLLNSIDRVAGLFGLVAMGLLAALIGSMIYEVAARYVFDAPTLWAFDISYMLNGSLFLIGSAYALKADAHVRIDFLSTALPVRVQQLWNAFIYLLVLVPIFAIFSYVAIGKAYKAYITNEVEMVSPWAPYVWPFFAAGALGIALLALQLFAEGNRFFLGQKQPGQTEDT